MKKETRGKRNKELWLSLLLIAAVVLAYLPALHGGFIWDDDDYVTQNPVLRSGEGLGRIWFEPNSLPQYYPLVYTSFWVEYHLFGLDSFGYHLDNVLIHALSALLLFVLLKRLDLRAAFLAAAVFALHPVQVESVAWITERKNVLSGFFYFLALLAWLRWMPLAGKGSFGGSAGAAPGRAGPGPAGGSAGNAAGIPAGLDTGRGPALYYWLSFAAFLCALLSKTVACSLPAVILVLIWWKRSRVGRRDIVATFPFFIAGLALAAVTAVMEVEHVLAKGDAWDFSFIERCLIAGRALWFYAGKLLFPARLTFNYPRWAIDASASWQYLFPAAALLVAVLLFLLRRRLGRGPLAAVLIFAGILVPALGFFNVYPMVYSFVADHFQYLASIGLIVLFAEILTRTARAIADHAPRGRAVAAGRAASWAAVVLLLVLGGLTWRQAHVYKDLETLWTDTIAKNPKSWLALGNLGGMRVDEGRYAEARRLLEESLHLKEPNPYAHNNLGLVLLQGGDMEGAQRELETAIRQRPDYAEPKNNLAVLLWRRANGKGRTAEERKRDIAAAVVLLEKALAIEPDYLDANRNIAQLYALQGEADKAMDRMRRVLAANPGDWEIRLGLAKLLMAAKRYREARDQYLKALRLRPGLEEARTGAAVAEEALKGVGSPER